eukprot:294672-Heterocapsa_arctica.AAC.1
MSDQRQAVMRVPARTRSTTTSPAESDDSSGRPRSRSYPDYFLEVTRPTTTCRRQRGQLHPQHAS